MDDYRIPSLDEVIERSGLWMHYCADAINAIKFEGWTQRTHAAGALYHLSMGHQQAIHILAGNQVHGSAFALFSPQLETYERGLWLHRGATDEQVSSFLAGCSPPSRKAMLDSLPEAEGSTIQSIMKASWSGLCDYTHGGAKQVAARLGPSGIDENFPPEQIAAMLIASCTLLLMVMNGFPDICESEDGRPMLAAAHAEFQLVVRGNSVPRL